MKELRPFTKLQKCIIQRTISSQHRWKSPVYIDIFANELNYPICRYIRLFTTASSGTQAARVFLPLVAKCQIRARNGYCPNFDQYNLWFSVCS